ncbi:MAG: MFS domain-containing histidine kinase, partial [Bacteroidales bacterium]|nr:MFS domain-containing histidine kinase [Bacteroidales bacterium]
SWNGQWSVSSDGIRQKMVVPVRTSQKDNIISPLSEVTSSVSYVNYGPKWYLVKLLEEDNCKVIGGLEIINTLDDRSFSGINPKFRLEDTYSARPLSYTDGYPVLLGGEAVFKIASDSDTSENPSSNAYLMWAAIAFFFAAALRFLYNNRTVRRFWITTAGILIASGAFYYQGLSFRNVVAIFSPTVYADGGVFFSIGAVIIVNLFLVTEIVCCFMIRRRIFRYILAQKRVSRMIIYTSSVVLVIAGIVVYTYWLFDSIIMNSNITFELFKLNELSVFTLLVYISLTCVMMSVPLLMYMLMPVFSRATGFSWDPISKWSRLIFSVAVSIFFVVATSVLGFKKEENKIDVWATRLTMDRDVSLEIQLRSVENDIASDQIISTLLLLSNSNSIIEKRIAESHLTRVTQDYDIHIVIITPDMNNDPYLLSYFNDRIRSGSTITEGSRFVYTPDVNGLARYTGNFVYYVPNVGVVRMLVGLDSRENDGENGYAAIFGYTSGSKVVLPSRYAYAKYVGDKMVMSRGNVPYSRILTDKIKEEMGEGGEGHYVSDGYSHIVRSFSDEEVIIVSRQTVERSYYLLELFFLGLMIYFFSHLLVLGRRRQKPIQKERAYYKSRINAVLLISLTVMLVVTASFSVAFVYRRNNVNENNLLQDRMSVIQNMLEGSFRNVESYQNVNYQDMIKFLSEVGISTNSDITLYNTSGKAFASTNNDVFDRMLIGARLDQNAFNNIVYRNKKFYLQRSKVGKHSYHMLYAPVYNASGKMLAIVGSPYSDENYDFETSAILHSMMVLVLFIILLMVARILVLAVVDKMFKPLTEMSRKMKNADIRNLQYIIYERDDEISPLVRSYNLMVHDLSSSTEQLAQAERDKAWSGMARQVAHEIKNPLTPMKLQIQRILSLKARNNPIWEQRFDEGAQIILDHIDMLTDTANEFSTFAKLYSEPSISINIDQLLQEEIAMFDNKDNITFTYYGLEGTVIEGPKPQLTRVFVNLITNSVQAIEQYQAEVDPEHHGEIIVSLRNSVKDGYYDIVVEDNGPGVDDQNRSKLFVPEFTTKSSGSGLGLAISRNIIEKCKGEIFYSKSFSLQGACFTVRYPKNS